MYMDVLEFCLAAVISNIGLTILAVALGLFTYGMRRMLRRLPYTYAARPPRVSSYLLITILTLTLLLAVVAWFRVSSVYQPQLLLLHGAACTLLIVMPLVYLGRGVVAANLPSRQETMVALVSMVCSGCALALVLLVSINQLPGKELLTSGPATVVELGRLTGLRSEIDQLTWQRVKIALPGSEEVVRTTVRKREADYGGVLVRHYRGVLGYEWFAVGEAGKPVAHLGLW